MNWKKLILMIAHVTILMTESLLMILILVIFYWIIKSQESLLIYDVAYRNLYGAKPLCISFDKIGGYIRKYDITNYLRLFYYGQKFEKIFGRIKYPVMLKNNISGTYSHKYIENKLIQMMIYP